MTKTFTPLFIAGLLLTTQLSAQVVVPNSGFEQSDPSSETKTTHWKAESDNFVCVADNNTSYKGIHSLRVSANTEGNHFFNAELPFPTRRLSKYRIRCAIKTEDLQGTAQLGARVFDKDGGTVTKTVFTLTENPDQEWTIAEGVFISDTSAFKLRVFGNLAGTGTIWFDEILVEELPASTQNPSDEVMLYIHEYFDLVYENSIIADKHFIARLKANTLYLCNGCTKKSECYDVLKSYTTRMLKDGHSFFTTPQEWKQMMGEGKHPVTGGIHQQMPHGEMLENKIAYIHVPMFIGSGNERMQQYADSLQNLIATFDKQNPAGYIIDLSENGGGNSLPMIAGIGPLIGNGVCGYSFSGDGSVRTRIYNDGWAGWDTTLTFHKPNPYQLKYSNKPVAVIYSNATGSSGEVTAIAFIGLPYARSFGQETAGATTRIDNFEMSDGAFLNLASGLNADRNKKQYGGTIQPDVHTQDTETAIEEGIRWILENSK